MNSGWLRMEPYRLFITVIRIPCMMSRNMIFIILSFSYLKESFCGPKFIAQPSDNYAVKGNTHWFPCIIDKLENGQSFQWYKNGRPINTGTRISIQSKENEPSSILLITGVVLADAGQYHCAIVQESNSKTIIQSRTATLIVHSLPSPQYPYCSVPTSTFIAGSMVTLSCLSQKVQPPVTLSWIHSIGIEDQVTILKEEGKNISLVFSVTARKEYNNAVFTCKQVSPLTTNKTNNFTTCSVGPLEILYKPEAMIQHANPTLPGRETIAFCQTSSNPPVTKYQWLFDPHIPADEYSIDETGQILKLLNPMIKQSGTNITCVATNSIGHVSSSIILQVAQVDFENEHTTGESTGSQFEGINKDIHLSLDVVIIIVAGVVIIVVLVVLVPVYHYCLCRNHNTTAVDSSGKEVIQSEVYYEAREGVILRHTIQDRSLPRVPTTEVYGHWRHSTASQVPNDLESHSYIYIDTEND
ncbi:synaptogenesis protein syg-1-like [Anneissia japonica]|uniref:synaptogenesis protein syg-1-like n=1 Tax=Anneissia japonica TaxID=1529436 RepID=UPI00142595E3|nr:synaptogenesis protein syg-1-like [Anneissia japonica]